MTNQETKPATVGEQEPVAWRVHPFDYGIGHEGVYATTHLTQQRDAWLRKGWNVESLYAAPVAQQQAKPRKADVARTCPFCNEEWVEQPQAEPDDEILKERDDAEDFIDMLLDEVLGTDRPEWTSAYGRDDALRDVQERMTALHKPTVDKAWARFEKAQQPQAKPDWIDGVPHWSPALIAKVKQMAAELGEPEQPQAEAVPSSDLDPDEGDPVTLWAEIWRLREAVKGPDGYATWQDAATAERIRRVRAESKHAAPPAQQYEAGDVASAAAQGFRDGVASVTQQEPVAWAMPKGDGTFIDVITPAEHAREEGSYTVPLFAHPAAQQPQAPTESVLIDGIAYDTPAPVAAELLRLHLGLKQPQAEAVPPTHVLAEAERYRWLRDKSVPPHNFYLSVPEEFHGVRYQPHEVDAYIDAAIAAAKKKEAGHE